MTEHERVVAEDVTAESGGELVPYQDARRHLSDIGIASTFDGVALLDAVDDGEVVYGEIVEEGEGSRGAEQGSRVVVPIEDVAFIGDILTGVAFGRVGAETWGLPDRNEAYQLAPEDDVAEVITIEAEEVAEPIPAAAPSAPLSTFEQAYGKLIPNELMALTPPELCAEKEDAEYALQAQEYPEGSDRAQITERLEHIDRLLGHWRVVYESWSPVKRFGYQAKDTVAEYMQIFLHDVVPHMYRTGVRALNRVIYGSAAYREATAAVKLRKGSLVRLMAEDGDELVLEEAEERLEEAYRTRWQISPARAQFADYVEERTRQVVEYSARALHNLTSRRFLS